MVTFFSVIFYTTLGYLVLNWLSKKECHYPNGSKIIEFPLNHAMVICLCHIANLMKPLLSKVEKKEPTETN